MDKNQAVIDYLLTCEDIQNSPLYFNFINAKDGTKQLLTLSNDKNIQKPYVDGSVEKRYQLTIQDYRSISSNALVNIPGFCNEKRCWIGLKFKIKKAYSLTLDRNV